MNASRLCASCRFAPRVTQPRSQPHGHARRKPNFVHRRRRPRLRRPPPAPRLASQAGARRARRALARLLAISCLSPVCSPSRAAATGRTRAATACASNSPTTIRMRARHPRLGDAGGADARALPPAGGLRDRPLRQVASQRRPRPRTAQPATATTTTERGRPEPWIGFRDIYAYSARWLKVRRSVRVDGGARIAQVFAERRLVRRLCPPRRPATCTPPWSPTSTLASLASSTS